MTVLTSRTILKISNVTSLTFAVILLLAVAAPVSAQEIPALTNLPAAVSASNHDLAGRRAALMHERDMLHGNIVSMNARCGAVEEGSAAEASCQKDQAELASALNAHIRESKDFNAVVHAAIMASKGPTLDNDPSVVDARNVPTGLPKSVEAEIPNTPSGDRVRKGFEAIMNHDWNAAHAWFQDALNHDPGNAGIQRLIDLAEYTMTRAQQGANAQDKAKIAALDRQMDGKMNADLAKALDDFNRNYMPQHPELLKPEKSSISAAGGKPHSSLNRVSNAESASAEQKVNWSAFFDALFGRPRRVFGVAAVRD
jgi:hypothetical protein